MPEQRIPFLTLFSNYIPEGDLGVLLARWQVAEASIDRGGRRMEARLICPAVPDRTLLDRVERELAAVYQMNGVLLSAEETQPAPPASDAERDPFPAQPGTDQDVFRRTEAIRRAAMKSLAASPAAGKKKAAGKLIFGTHPVKKQPIPMSSLELDMGVVAVEGDVFSVEHRQLKRRNAWVVSFDMTDYTGSVRVSKFMPGEEGRPLVEGVKTGQHLAVQGRLNINRFDNDLVLEPTAVSLREKKKRSDQAPQKRVELHLHTKMSAMDALTDTGKAVERAIEWGHPAIGITDHGVVQAFPDAWNAARGKIKILYGVEAYFNNDVDDRVAVHGGGQGPLSAPVVAFDIETTGLDSRQDAITEIGAVVLENGAITDTFQTFVNPGRRLTREIVNLTGITDDMVAGAPSQQEAVSAFLEFAAGRPLAAHNADFDIGFIAACCRRMGRTFEAVSIDTLVLAQNLLPGLGKYKLDTVAEHLKLPSFQHHRASDDAATAAYLLRTLFAMLADRGVHTIEGINPAMEPLRRSGGSARRTPRHVIVMVKNRTGLRNLYKLISLSHLEHFKRFPIMPKSLLNANREGLLIGSACEGGELFQAIVRQKSWEELKRIASWYDFLEIQPLSNNAFMLRPDRTGRAPARDEEQLREWNRTVVKLGKELGKPVCATGDVHFLEPEDEIYRHILLDTKGYEDADAPNPLYFRTTEEMLREFSYLGEDTARQVVIESPNLVAGWCETVKPLPDGLYTPTLENSAGELADLVWNKAKELYGEYPPAVVTDRVNAELSDIMKCKYDVIYMSAQKLVQNSLEAGYLVGSRGSVGSSIVAFLSGITEVNALPPHYRCPNCRHSDFAAGEGYGCGADMPDALCPVCRTPYAKDGFHIPFETFLGFDGDKVPDIDLNFSGEYQASAHKYTFELFGENHVFRAGTIGTVAEKTAFGYVKKYLEARGSTVSRAEENRLALGCTGVKRTTGQHPGGMVVIPQDREIYDFCPVQHPADDTGTDIITTHFEYHSMESNLLKLDMLGHDDPTMIRMLEDLTGVDARAIPLDDADTRSIFTSSRVLGYTDDKVLGPTGACAIPEFGTSFVRGMLVDTRPTEFDTLVRLSGFSHGTDVWLGNARDLILTGTATVGQAIGCRDDIMLYLIKRGMEERRAFKIMESVRKGKGLPAGAEEEMKRLGVPEWYIESCRKIKYLFPKAHAVAYVMMAFRIAWFKVHRPLAFYAAYFSIRAKAFDEAVMCRGIDLVKDKMRAITARDKEAAAVEQDMLVTLEVCYEFYLRGFTFEGIDLYRSDATRFLMEEEKKSLLPPFVSIPGLGETAALSIAEQRKGRTFISAEELADACPKVSKTHIEQLRAAGALGSLPDTSQLSLF